MLQSFKADFCKGRRNRRGPDLPPLIWQRHRRNTLASLDAVKCGAHELSSRQERQDTASNIVPREYSREHQAFAPVAPIDDLELESQEISMRQPRVLASLPMKLRYPWVSALMSLPRNFSLNITNSSPHQ